MDIHISLGMITGLIAILGTVLGVGWWIQITISNIHKDISNVHKDISTVQREFNEKFARMDERWITECRQSDERFAKMDEKWLEVLKRLERIEASQH